MSDRFNSWRTYFDKCWIEVYPELTLPYHDTSPETVRRMRVVARYAECKAGPWRLFRRWLDATLYRRMEARK